MSSIRVFCCFLLMGLMMASLGAAADPSSDQPEPPVRLKKKVKPEPAPGQSAKPAAKTQPLPKDKPPPETRQPKNTPESSLEDLQEKVRELMNRVSKNMSQVEKRLRKQDPGEITQQTEQDIVRDLDRLIEQSKRQQQQRQQQQAQSSSSSSLSQAGRRRRQQNGGRGQGAPSNPSQARTPSGNNPRGGKSSQGGTNKIADLYKDVWGHLPESLRQEMDQYAREQFMAKYSDLLKQYYATIAEKGRRKEEP
jgi:outer membrane biosynthesis protein TonB